MLDRFRHRHELEADDPGAPPGFLLDIEDRRVFHAGKEGGCVATPPREDESRDEKED